MSDKTSAELCEEIETLDAVATSGPWEATRDDSVSGYISHQIHSCATASGGHVARTDEQFRRGCGNFCLEASDAEFIARSRTLLPEAAAVIRELLALLRGVFAEWVLEDGLARLVGVPHATGTGNTATVPTAAQCDPHTGAILDYGTVAQTKNGGSPETTEDE